MSLFVKDFRSKILGCSAHRKSTVLDDVHFGESEVSQPKIANIIDKNIFRFQTKSDFIILSVNDVPVVKVL